MMHEYDVRVHPLSLYRKYFLLTIYYIIVLTVIFQEMLQKIEKH